MKKKYKLVEGLATEAIAQLIPPEKPQLKTRLAFISVAIEIHFNWDLAKKTHKVIAQEVQEFLPTDKYELLRAPEPFQDEQELCRFLDEEKSKEGNLAGIILCHAAYTTGEVASALGIWLRKAQIPVFSYSLPEPVGTQSKPLNLQANRLCSQNFVCGIFRNLGVKYQWLFCQMEDPKFKEECSRFARVCRALHLIRGRKALIAGAGRVPGFYDCEVNEVDVMKRFELGFDRVNLIEITSKMSKFLAKDIAEIQKQILAHPECRLNNVPDEQFEKSIRLALALMHTAREGNYIGVSFKNWPELFDHFQIAGDGAMALVNDQGIAISDETDTGALMTMIVFKELFENSLPLLSDVSYLSEDGLRLGIWHNGSAATRLRKTRTGFECRRHGILENYDLETAWGLLFEFLIEPGPVTVAKYQAPSLNNVLAFEGELVEAELKFRGTYGEIQCKDVSAAQVVGSILDYGLDHHWIIGRGHFLADLQVFNYWTGINEIPINNPGQQMGFGNSLHKGHL